MSISDAKHLAHTLKNNGVSDDVKQLAEALEDVIKHFDHELTDLTKKVRDLERELRQIR